MRRLGLHFDLIPRLNRTRVCRRSSIAGERIQAATKPVSRRVEWVMQSVNRFLFGPTPEERVKKWQTQLKTESRALDREIRQLDMASNKVKTDVRKLAQKGDTKNAKLLAREVVRSNKQKDRLHTSQARLNSINMQLSHQLGTREGAASASALCSQKYST